jgi:hypothetical protein
MEIFCRNVNDALARALSLIKDNSTSETSRNGPVLVFKEPVTTVYSHPRERVLFSPLRDANPFFHLMESIWMLAGRNDVVFPQQFNKRFGSYSDDGKTQPGAYGFRWRKFFGYDQLRPLVDELRTNPDTRRAVLAMWDGGTIALEGSTHAGDLRRLRQGTKDAPCNTHIYFDRRSGALNMTVCCRSNDLFWGAYGANAVHFSVLQEWVAFAVGVPVGVYRQMSNNLHLYTDVVNPKRLNELSDDSYHANAYTRAIPPRIFRLVNHDAWMWLEDAEKFCAGQLADFREPFFWEVALPMLRAWKDRTMWQCIAAEDWRLAVSQWVARREARKAVTA